MFSTGASAAGATSTSVAVFLRVLAALLHRAAELDQAAAENQKREVRHARNQAHQHENAARDHQHARVREELAGQLRADVFVGRDARDDHTGRRRNHQRRDLCDEAVTDRQQRVGLAGGREVHAVLHHPDDQAADDVDHHDQQAGDRIAAHELAGAVHRTVELGFLRDFQAALAGLIFVDEAGVQVGVDRHLLAGHRVEREARGHFRDPPRALGDHHEVDDHQNDEDDDTDREVAAHEEVAERLDHLARRVRAGMAFEQHDARGRHVQRQAQQGREQQHARESGEVERLHRVHADEQHHHGKRDIEGEQQIQQKRRQRQNHHAEDHADQHRPGEGAQIGAAQGIRPSGQESGASVHAEAPEASSLSGLSASAASCSASSSGTPPLSRSAGTSNSVGATGATPPSVLKRRN